MGSGASSSLTHAIEATKAEDLQAVLCGLPAETQAKVLAGLGVCPVAQAAHAASSVDPQVIAARTATIKAAFHHVAVEQNGVKMVPIAAAAALLTPLGLPHGRKTMNLLRSFDADGNGQLDVHELDKFLEKAVADNLEAASAIKLAKKIKRTKKADFCRYVDVARAPEGHDPTKLKPALEAIIAKHAASLATLECNGDAETANLHGALTKLGNDLLNPPAPKDGESCEQWLTQLVSVNGFHWAQGQFKTEVPFGEWTTGRLPAGFSEALDKGGANLEAASAKWGPGFDRTMELYANQMMTWVPEVVDDKAILSLEEPAIFAFSFGTGAKIGIAVDTPSLVGPGCETPGLMNCGLAQTIKNILAVRKMPVFAQWEIADALCFGEGGCPEAMYESFSGWDFEDDLPDGDVGVANPYPRVGTYDGAPVYRSLPIWPRAVEQGLVKQEELADAKILQPYYLSTGGVLEQNRQVWAHGLGAKPRTVLIVGHPDHRIRCASTTKELFILNSDGTSGPLGMENIVIPADKFYDDWTKYKCDKFAYDSTSSQPWTTKRPFFCAKEAAVRNWLYLRGDFGPLPFQGPPKDAKVHAAEILQLAKKQMLSMLQTQDWDEDNDE